MTHENFTEYQTLQKFVSDIANACFISSPTSEEQPVSLVHFLESVRKNIWARIRENLSRSLIECAERLGWPSPINYLTFAVENRNEFEQAFQNLLILQKIEQEFRPRHLHVVEGLYPMQALVQPISNRFKYHFGGDRETNRIDKPEWYLTHILNLVHDHRHFMESVVQALLISGDFTRIDAWAEFTNLLLLIISRKLEETIPTMLPHPSLLAHTIYQTLAFDAALLEAGHDFRKSSTNDVDRGTSDIILRNRDWFEAWLCGERKFADNHYIEIITSPDAWILESIEEHLKGHQTRSTNSARRLCRLIEQITERYCVLPEHSQRCRFLLCIQLPLLNRYHDLIVSSLDAFESFSATLVRAVPGALAMGSSGSDEVNMRPVTTTAIRDVSGIQRLCKAILSAELIQMALRKWDEEPIFVELWDQMNETHTLDASLFEVMIDRFAALITRGQDMIVRQAYGEIESDLKVHLFSDPIDHEPPMQLDVHDHPQSLLVPVTLLSSYLMFIRSIFSRATLADLYRRITSRLADHMLSRQIRYRSKFTSQEGKRLLSEYQLWMESCFAALDGALGGGKARVETPWAKLLQAANLVSSEGDIWIAALNFTFGAMSDTEWAEAMSQIFSSIELARDEVAIILRQRVDCDR